MNRACVLVAILGACAGDDAPAGRYLLRQSPTNGCTPALRPQVELVLDGDGASTIDGFALGNLAISPNDESKSAVTFSWDDSFYYGIIDGVPTTIMTHAAWSLTGDATHLEGTAGYSVPSSQPACMHDVVSLP